MTTIIKLSLLTLLCSSAIAMDLSHKLGVGFSNHLVTDTPMLSVKYHSNERDAYSGLLAVDTQEDSSVYALGFKYFRNIYKEENLNFYSSIALQLISYEIAADKDTGYQVDWSFGTEFSFKEFKSLGFSLEFGLSALDYQNKSSIKTNANNILKSAVHFYL